MLQARLWKGCGREDEKWEPLTSLAQPAAVPVAGPVLPRGRARLRVPPPGWTPGSMQAAGRALAHHPPSSRGFRGALSGRGTWLRGWKAGGGRGRPRGTFHTSLPAAGAHPGSWRPGHGPGKPSDSTGSSGKGRAPRPAVPQSSRGPGAHPRSRAGAAGRALSSGKRRHRQASDLVVNVGRALGRHLLHYVHWVPIVPADLLVVGAEDAVRSPQGDDDVAGLRAVVVPAALGRGQRAQRQRGRVLRRVLAVPPPVLEQEHHQRDDDDDEDDAPRGNPCE